MPRNRQKTSTKTMPARRLSLATPVDADGLRRAILAADLVLLDPEPARGVAPDLVDGLGPVRPLDARTPGVDREAVARELALGVADLAVLGVGVYAARTEVPLPGRGRKVVATLVLAPIGAEAYAIEVDLAPVRPAGGKPR